MIVFFLSISGTHEIPTRLSILTALNTLLNESLASKCLRSKYQLAGIIYATIKKKQNKIESCWMKWKNLLRWFFSSSSFISYWQTVILKYRFFSFAVTYYLLFTSDLRTWELWIIFISFWFWNFSLFFIILWNYILSTLNACTFDSIDHSAV